jgi:hypothetical protein
VTKKQRVLDFAAARGWTAIGETEWNELRAGLPGVSETTIRRAGMPIAQPWRGVAQHTLDELDSSLREMSGVYARRPDLRRYCRDQVIAAKDRARWVSRGQYASEDQRVLKTEMVEWMLVWLGDPAMFAGWAEMRRGQIGDAPIRRVEERGL